MGSKKLGQPVPLSNFAFESEERQAAGGAHEGARALLLVQRARERALGALLEEHGVALRGEQLAPLGLRLVELGFGHAALLVASAAPR